MEWLRRPFPFSHPCTYWWRTATIGGLFVTVFLFVFRPYGIHHTADTQWGILEVCAQYGLVTSLVSVVWAGLMMIGMRFFREESWTVAKEVWSEVAFIALLALGNLLFTAAKFGLELSIANYLQWLLVTAAVGIFPILYGVFNKQIALAKQYTTEAASINSHLHPPASLTAATLEIVGDNQGERLSLPMEAFRYAEAADNYVKVVWLNPQGQLTTQLLRTTLQRLETAFAHAPELFRCHRSYLVHLGTVTHLSGNAQGYKLHLKQVDFPIPVSRALNQTIQQKLA